MEGEESVLGSIFEDDVEMVDVEDGELVEDEGVNADGLSVEGGVEGNLKDKDGVSGNSKSKKRNRNRKNKKKRSAAGPNVTDVNRFVLDTCRRLKEKKSYMIYNAVGCLGVTALTDILKEIDAIQTCGGQMTADGRRKRTGGGILWNILKTREPKAYKEIMNKSKDFEKQFRPQSVGPAPEPTCNKMTFQVEAHQPVASHSFDAKPKDNPQFPLVNENLAQAGSEKFLKQSKLEAAGIPKPVHDRIRVPVRYDDLFEEYPTAS